MKKFFVNAPGSTRRRRRKTRKATARRRRATPPRGRGGRFIRRKRKVTTVARKRRTRKRSSARRSTARRRVRISAPRRRRLRKGRVVTVRRRSGGRTRAVRRRSYRQNPGMLAIIMRGVIDAGFVTGGKVATNLATRAIPFQLPLPGIAGDVVKGLGVAALVSIAASKVLTGGGGMNARMISAGAFQAVLESVLRTVQVPMVSTALGEYDILANTYTGLGNYPGPAALMPGLASYPPPQFEGEQYAYEQQG